MKDEIEKVLEEARRQHELLERTWESIDNKLQLVIGAAATIFGYVLVQKDFLSILGTHNYQVIGIFLVGITLVAYSGINAYLGFSTKTFSLGPDIEQLRKRMKKSSNLSDALLEAVSNSLLQVKNESKKKSGALRFSMKMIGLGLMAIVISNFLNYLLTHY